MLFRQAKMRHILSAVWIGLLALLMVGLSSVIYHGEAQASPEERVNAYLAEAQIPAGLAELSAELVANPDDDNLRFAVGFLQFADTVQTFGQAGYRYGLRSQSPFTQIIPFLRIPVPVNPEPAPISNAEFRQVLEDFVTGMMQAEAVLSEIDSEAVQLGVYLGRGYFDFDADGQGSDEEALWRIYAQISRQPSLSEDQIDSFLINFDAGDVQWLRGYCHL